jgi:quercetin 2,3-dioxygenase
MIRLRPSQDRGQTRIDWLDSKHTFSFGTYFDPDQMGFRSLRVINDDRIKPAAGFGMHGHKNMEIITLVLAGELEHADSLGHGSVLRPGEVQAMSAGTGIRHSEFNPSPTEPTHFLQIWIEPDRLGLAPAYQQAEPKAWNGSPWRLLAHPHDPKAAVSLAQDAEIWQGRAVAGERIEYALRPGRGLWLHVVGGTLKIGQTELGPGDAVGIEDEEAVTLMAETTPANFLLFDLGPAG